MKKNISIIGGAQPQEQAQIALTKRELDELDTLASSVFGLHDILKTVDNKVEAAQFAAALAPTANQFVDLVEILRDRMKQQGGVR